MHLGEHLRAWRKKLGMTQKEVADKAGIHPASLTNIETGKRTPLFVTMVPLCKALHLTLEDAARWVR